ncbi:putative S-adenosylmethionine-dependent methyltransferase [uncultured archaeon]|nr:putative S-adenosylmethionine-dependent methyltransferase [uncultured archaeon]
MHISFGTLRLEVFPTVYEPAEDSFLLATYASGISGGKKVLEIGCGTGIASISAAKADEANTVLGVDINPQAVECAAANAEANGAKNCRFMQASLFSSIPDGSKFDFILFNPPYLPTTREEKLSLEDENAAYDGGESGLETFMQFAEQVSEHLAPGGKVAVIATSLNDGVKKTLGELEKRVGTAQILAEESFFFEKIYLVEAVKR